VRRRKCYVKIYVLCADHGIPPDGTKGASLHLRAVAEGLVKLGHEVTAFVSVPSQGSDSFPTPLRRLSSAHSILGYAMAEGRPDVVYERYSLGHTDGLLAAGELEVPFVLEVNAPLLLEAAAHREETIELSHAEAETRLFRQADLVVTVSKPLREYVTRVRGSSDGTAVIRNGCDERLFPRAAPLRDGAKTLVFLGHPKPWHGAGGLPRVLANLLRRGHDVRLLLVGGGPGAEEVMQEALIEKVSERVEVTGPLPHGEATRRLLDGTIAVAPFPPLPFFYFCPLKVIDCMAAGLPVVTTAQGDLPAILDGTGVLVPPGDEQAFVETLEKLLLDASLRQSLGKAARSRALNALSWSKSLKELLGRLADHTSKVSP
jgi:glycosyltransferase involved in cell wall biosynthesis